MSDNIQKALDLAKERMTVSRLGSMTARVMDKDILAFKEISYLLEAQQKLEEQVTESSGMYSIMCERIHQVRTHGYDPAGDVGRSGELIRAANCYTQYALMMATIPVEHLVHQDHPSDIDWDGKPLWPWGRDSWKPADTVERNLTKGAALIAAAMDARKAEQANGN